MNIVEAFQAAEQGRLITNTFLKSSVNFLKYIGNGKFHQYEIINGEPYYKCDVNSFPMSYILDIGWEIIE